MLMTFLEYIENIYEAHIYVHAPASGRTFTGSSDDVHDDLIKKHGLPSSGRAGI